MSSGEGWESVSQPTMPTLQDDLLEKLLGVANRAKSFTSAGGAAIALGSGKHFVVSATCGTSLEVGATVPLPSTLAGFRSLKSNALRYGDTDKEATIDGNVCRSARIKSMLVVPVGDLSDVGAVLAVFSSAVNAFTETHIAVLKTLAEVISNLLPEKAKLVETAPEKKTGEFLEHPFDPTFDNLPKKVEVGSSPLNELSEPASAVLDSAMRAPRASLSPPVPPPAVEILAGGDAYTNPAPAPPRVPKPPPAKASTPPTSGWRGPNAREVLNLAADPVVKRSSSSVAPARKRDTPRPSTGSGRAYKTRSYKRFFVVAVASLAILALLRLGY